MKRGRKKKLARASGPAGSRSRDEATERRTGNAPVSIDWRPNPFQKRLAKAADNAEVRTLLGLAGIKTGKSTGGAYIFTKSMYERPMETPLAWLLSPTYPMSIVLERKFQQIAGPLILDYKKNPAPYYLLRPSESTAPFPIRVEVKSADRPRGLLGTSVSRILWDEPAECDEETYDVCIGRVMDCSGLIYMTGTPKGYNWMHRRVWMPFLEGITDTQVVKGRTEDNCREHSGGYIPHDEIERVRSKYSERLILQDLEGEFVSFEGLVYAALDLSANGRNVIDSDKVDYRQMVRSVFAMDFGFSDPFACYRLWRDRAGCWYADSELYGAEVPIETWATMLKDLFKRRKPDAIYADPEDKTARNVLTRYDIWTQPAKKDLMVGIQHVVSLIEKGRFKIVRDHCPMLLNEATKYQYPTRDGRNRGEKPVDAWNHGWDAVRYGLFTEYVHYERGGTVPEPAKRVDSIGLKPYTQDQMTRYARAFKEAHKQENKSGYPKWYLQ